VILTAISPADYLETLRLVRASSAFMRGSAPKAALQVFASLTIGYVDARERQVAVLGLYPAGGGLECWLHGDPDLARPHLLAIARHARLTLAALADSHPAPIHAHVHRDHEPGRRLARLVGFNLLSPDDAAPLQRWEWRHGSAGAVAVRRQERQ